MQKPTLSSYIRQKLRELKTKKEPGPYITISRQPGCEGYKVGDVLLEMLNDADEYQRWRLYKKEILKHLAEDAELNEELIERLRHERPNLCKEFFRGMSGSGIPDGFEVRSKITAMVRTVAYEGFAIIIGQGGTAATADLANGLSVRIEAPKQWRMIRICRRDNLSKEEAIVKMAEEEAKRSYLRTIYEQTNPRMPAFNLLFDNSVFTAEQIASQIYYALQLKNMIPPAGL
jgi:hypothetical protein